MCRSSRAALLTLVLSGTIGDVHAQQHTAVPAMVGVTGRASKGGQFADTFAVRPFDVLPATGSVAAFGNVSGIVNGRSIVTHLTDATNLHTRGYA